MKKNSGLIRKIISIIAILVIIFCASKIIYKQYEYHKGTVTNTKLQKIMNLDTKENPTIKDFQSILDNQNKLLKINPDYKMWLKINGTPVDYPVVQTNNNYYYLHHNFYNEKSIEGTLFINYKTNLKTSRNVIIFGHNMRNDSMFGSLGLFKTNFFNTHKYLYIVEGNTVKQYEIFFDGVFHADYPYIIADFKTQKDFMDYINAMKTKAYYWRDVTFDKDTKLLTLSTCSYEFSNARFVIMSKLVKTYTEPKKS